jgi:unsaturated rhamnogalacturonyl hydrolase
MLINLLKSALKFQDDNGMWHQEMTDFDSYPESSGTGLILYALGVALELGICPAKWRENFTRGLKGYSAYIAIDGSVHNCCIGCLSPGDGSKEAYKARKWELNDSHAFGPVGLAFAQAWKLGIKELKVEND